MSMINLYVGYDEREAIAYHVFCHSVIKNTSIPVKITPLVLSQLKEFNETHQDRSNDFVYSRFLTPYLNEFKGWAIFVDGDMICQADLKELIEMADPNKALMVVKHDYETKASIKYLGNINENYPRKNWSSFILFNCSHPKNKTLSVDLVNKETGAFLHQFKWLEDDEIGSLDERWNWLEGWTSGHNNQSPYAVHYTRGGPWFDEWQDVEFAKEWINERDEYLSKKFTT